MNYSCKEVSLRCHLTKNYQQQEDLEEEWESSVKNNEGREARVAQAVRFIVVGEIKVQSYYRPRLSVGKTTVKECPITSGVFKWVLASL